MLRLLCMGGACLALAFGAGCGGDDDENTGASGAGATQSAPAETQAQTTEAQTETSAGTSASGGAITVKIKNFAFDPPKVEAKVGQKITWVNEDDAPHNAVAENGGDLKTKTFEKGGSDSYTVDEAGTIKYICTVHPQMHGTIIATK